MRVVMKHQISGTRDGQEWPAPGGEIELPDVEGAMLCAQGMAEPVETRGKDEEKATAPKASTRSK
ncbi:hypothetical protein [Actinomadura rupiterrae]|uniref:hypothetical protein n=1 Tax=Actinomadura rupiterrae TaxID=559627 RepID=UPI0020A331E1|nr:hypothetical protein [Actinomadura rupiterrae]MCP2339171.1 hypothetical protein [Actinomadura rupiterrae]